MGLGLLVLAQVILAAQQLEPFYTDSGVLPRNLQRPALDALGLTSAWTVYSAVGSSQGVAGGLCLTALAAVALIAGWQTRVATLACVVLLGSLQMRNPLITTGGDVLLRCLLVWGCFVPWGAVASWDARRLSTTQARGAALYRSWGTAGLILQLLVMYFCSGIAKTNSAWWSGEAVSISLQLEMSVRPWAVRLQEWPALLKGMTWGTWLAELAVPLMCSPWGTARWRGLGGAVFVPLHLGIAACFSIGVFSAVSLCAWLMFVPGSWWERLGWHWPEVESATESTLKADSYWRARFRRTEFVAAGLLALMIGLNTMNTAPQYWQRWGYRGWYDLASSLMFVQEFKMFGSPPTWNPQFIYRAEQGSGDWQVIPLAGGATTDLGEGMYAYLGTQAWRRYHWNLLDLDFGSSAEGPSVPTQLRQRLVDYHATHQRNEEDADWVQVELIVELIPLAIPGQAVRQPARECWGIWRGSPDTFERKRSGLEKK
jgi:hypothetical protein